jgi:hypothetical protein
MLISTALEASANQDPAARGLAEELGRVLQLVEGTLLIEENDLMHEHVHWLRETGPAHGLTRARIDGAPAELAERDGCRPPSCRRYIADDGDQNP